MRTTLSNVNTVKQHVPLTLTLIPTWLEAKLRDENLELDKARDAETLIRILSLEDIAAYLYLNLTLTRWLGEPVAESFQEPSWIWQVIGQEERLSGLIESHRIRHDSSKLLSPCTTELFGPLSEPTTAQHVSYKVVASSADNAVSLLPSLRGTPHMTNEALLDDLLYVVNMHMSMEGLAKLPMFRAFLNIV